MAIPPRAVRLTDRAPLEFEEAESLIVRTRRKLTFRAPTRFIAGADLVLPEDNAAEGALTKVGNVLTWVPGGGGGITAAEAQALIDASLVDYQLLSEKDQADGYASLDGSTLVPAAELGTGTPTSAKFLDGSRAWRVLADADIPAAIARDAEVTAALAAYQLLSEKNAASGYAGLDGSTLLDIDHIAPSPSATKFLRGDQTWQTLSPAVGAGDLSWESARQAGTSPLECWYIGGILNANTLGAGGTAPTAGVMFAFPYPAGRGGTLDRIAFEVTTVGGAGSRARVGIYKATSLSNLYPDALLVDGGEKNTSGGGVHSSTINVVLPTDRLLWFVILVTGGGGAVALVRNVAATTNAPVTMGYPSTLGASAVARTGLSVTQAYGALPDPFTAGGAMFGGGASPFGTNIPVIAVRYSS